MFWKNCFLKIIVLSLICFLFSQNVIAQQTRGSGNRQLRREAATSEKRLALVIGNGAYQNAAPLSNPTNDATDVAATLRTLGFEVLSDINQTLPQMRKLVREFGAKLKQNGGVGLFYYAGHGIQVAGRNFLVPVEAKIETEVETEDVALDVNSVLRQMDTAGNGFNIVILDACRNNPFARSWNRDIGSGGLAQINAPTGTLIAYATSPDSIASDGSDRNGLYTAALLTQIKRPNVDLLRMFQNVRTEVKQKSSGRQVPWESNSTTGDFYFSSVLNPESTQATKPKQKHEVENNLSIDVETSYWMQIEKSNYIEDFSEYLKEYPNGRFASLARQRVNSIKRSKTETETEIPENLSIEQYFRIGDAHHTVGEFSKAIPYYTKAIERYPNNDEAYSRRGYSYHYLGEYDKAIADYNRAIELNPNEASDYVNRGNAYKNKKEYDSAIANYIKAAILTPKDQYPYYMCGFTYYEKQDYDRAIVYFTKSIGVKPNYDNYEMRARSYEAKGDKAQAAADRQKANELLGKNK